MPQKIWIASDEGIFLVNAIELWDAPGSSPRTTLSGIVGCLGEIDHWRIIVPAAQGADGKWLPVTDYHRQLMKLIGDSITLDKAKYIDVRSLGLKKTEPKTTQTDEKPKRKVGRPPKATAKKATKA